MEICRLTVLGSSSSGNSYILNINGEIMLIECGIPAKAILCALDYDLSNVSGCISTHLHHDHVNPLTVKKLLSYGISVYGPQSVCEVYPKCKRVEHLHKYKIGGFTVMPLRVPHGDCECFAYYINLPDGQTLFFATDLQELPWTINGIDVLMLECNYCDETVLNNLCNGADIHSQPDNHLSLEKAVEVTRRLYSAKLNKVILLHLSDGNSDENLIKRRFKEELCIDVLIAESGLTVDLDEDDF